MNRRQFCTHACQAASLVGVAAFVDACGGSPSSPDGPNPSTLPTVNGSVSGNVVSVSIDASSPLASTGSAAAVQSSAGGFLVFRVDSATFNVMTSVCTHEGCTVSGIASQTFVCPCHGSQYSSSGTVVQGPATRPLQRYTPTFANNVLTFPV
jgi:cytochrome b6-f complex iron-sulfur subunit